MTMGKDSERAMAATRALLDGRDPRDSAVLVTLEQTVALILLAYTGTPFKAAKMLNEGLVQGVEERLALYASRKGGAA